MNKKYKVFVTDDHPIIRNGLISEINAAKNFEVIGEAENGEIAIQKISILSPDIIILDIDMPVLDGIETAKIINSNFAEIKIVFLSMYKEEEIIHSISGLNMMGYVLKDSAILEIVECLEEVAQGKQFFSPVIEEILKTVQESAFSSLSNTEMAVLSHISELKTSREIAENLFISVRTVENHRYKISKKLNVQGNHALLKFAIDNKKLLSEYNKIKSN